MAKPTETTLQFYGADESAPPGTLGHALAAFDRLLVAVEESREATQAFANDGQPGNWIRYQASEEKLDAAIRACKELRK